MGIVMTNATLFVGLVAAFVTVLGWFLTRRWEAQTRRLEQDLRYKQRQIEEFYGPLYNLMHQIFAAEEVQGNFLAAAAEKESEIRKYFQDNYFFPFHSEMLRILKDRLYLAEGAAVPSSFDEYLKHACDDRVRSALQVFPEYNWEWPDDFEEELKQGFRSVMGEYNGLLDRLTVNVPSRKSLSEGKLPRPKSRRDSNAASRRGSA
jgi:hypothetical protein